MINPMVKVLTNGFKPLKSYLLVHTDQNGSTMIYKNFVYQPTSSTAVTRQTDPTRNMFDSLNLPTKYS